MPKPHANEKGFASVELVYDLFNQLKNQIQNPTGVLLTDGSATGATSQVQNFNLGLAVGGQTISVEYPAYKLLSSADILALHTTPIVLVPARGIGKAILLTSCCARLNYGGTAYTGSFIGGEIVTSSGTGGTAQTFLTATFIKASGNRWFPFGFSSSPTASSIALNEDLVIKADAQISTGNSTIEIWFTWREISG